MIPQELVEILLSCETSANTQELIRYLDWKLSTGQSTLNIDVMRAMRKHQIYQVCLVMQLMDMKAALRSIDD